MKTLMEKDLKSLREEALSCRKELFTLHMNAMVGQLKDTSQFRKIRRQIARIKTAMTMKQSA